MLHLERDMSPYTRINETYIVILIYALNTTRDSMTKNNNDYAIASADAGCTSTDAFSPWFNKLWNEPKDMSFGFATERCFWDYTLYVESTKASERKSVTLLDGFY